jgi:decaprenylphospho-beta-D-ribofuranose 2-oxidase
VSLLQPETSAPAAAALRPDAVTGWGGGERCPLWRLSATTPEEAERALPGLGHRATAGAIARGMGRSYGDAAQRRHGVVVETRAWRGLQIDSATGAAVVETGATIGELLAAAIPYGLIVPVVPGTQHVSIGGAIASDIHGKNHGTFGTFGRHVEAIGLIDAEGELHELSPAAPDRLFEATLGGMGLTGVIAWARVRLRRVESSRLTVDTDRAGTLDETLALLDAPGGEHRVAWLDLLGSLEPRGVVTRAAHAGPGALDPDEVATRPRATVPAAWPAGLLRPATVRAFNELRFRTSPKRERGREEPFARHMCPLDGLAAWPRLYGRRGFVQYQLVVPRGQERVLRDVLAVLAGASVPCYLAVLKDFGPAGEGILSFPMRGWTLALDLPRAAAGLPEAVALCDRLVAEAGGRVYLSKDSLLSPELLPVMYPRLEEWRAIRDAADPEGLWRSDLALRTGLVAA